MWDAYLDQGFDPRQYDQCSGVLTLANPSNKKDIMEVNLVTWTCTDLSTGVQCAVRGAMGPSSPLVVALNVKEPPNFESPVESKVIAQVFTATDEVGHCVVYLESLFA